jgi:transcriptional regulator with XRE-family HTH domain
MTLGEKLQQLRKSKSMSQEQLATQITVSRQAISKWELGESMPDTDNILQLSKLFGVSTDYLLNDEMNSIINIYSNVTKQGDLPKHHYTSMVSKICIGIEIIALMLGFLFILFWIPKCTLISEG